MLAKLKQEWRELRQGRPGRRFRDHYERARKEREQTGWARALRLGISVVCILIGIVLAFIPGPAVVFFFLAGGLLATESFLVARFMDWTERLLRATWAALRKRFGRKEKPRARAKRSPAPARAAGGR